MIIFEEKTYDGEYFLRKDQTEICDDERRGKYLVEKTFLGKITSHGEYFFIFDRGYFSAFRRLYLGFYW
jgi:hypothetical protein